MKIGLAITLLTFACASPRDVLREQEIDPKFRDHADDFTACYTRAKAQNAGTVTLFFVITRDGLVSNASVRDTTLNNPGVEGCTLKILNGMQFSPPDQGRLEIVYPLRFARR